MKNEENGWEGFEGWEGLEGWDFIKGAFPKLKVSFGTAPSLIPIIFTELVLFLNIPKLIAKYVY